MIKEAFQWIMDRAEINTKDVNGVTYTTDCLSPVFDPKFNRPETLVFHTLSGLVAYIVGFNYQETYHFLEADYFCHILNHNEVVLTSTLIQQAGNVRHKDASAKNTETAFNFGSWYNLEDFIIAIQSQFIEDENTNGILGMLGNLANEQVRTAKDDGFTQSLQVKTGITTKSNVEIKNPVTLRPYRTFREVDQPEGKFILRFQDRGGLQCALFESDGGAWKIEAIKNIKDYLEWGIPDGVKVFG